MWFFLLQLPKEKVLRHVRHAMMGKLTFPGTLDIKLVRLELIGSIIFQGKLILSLHAISLAVFCAAHRNVEGL